MHELNLIMLIDNQLRRFHPTLAQRAPELRPARRSI
jgi:hypothetical protein